MVKDISLNKCVAQAVPLIEAGATVHQKFTCGKCGARNTMEDANRFFIEGTCGDCGYVTDLQKQGCGYLLHFGLKVP